MAAAATLSPMDVLAHAAALFTYYDPIFGPVELSWGDVWYEEWKAAEALLTPAQVLARAEADAARRARMELEGESARMATYARDCKYRNTVRQGRQYTLKKVALPCKNLYYDEKAPKSQWKKDEHGKLRAPMRAGLTGSECWAWAYTDPATGARVVKHTCSHLHPDEAEWLPQWSRDRAYRPSAADAGLAAWGAARR